MIYLNQALFRPMCILLSIVFLPISIACWVITFLDFRIEVLIVSVCVFLFYIATLFVTYNYSKTIKYFLCKKNDLIIIKYHSLNNNGFFEIPICNIINIEYYRLSSIKGWCMLYNYVCPQCAYITYLNDEKEISLHIGYPTQNDIENLCKAVGIKLILK